MLFKLIVQNYYNHSHNSDCSIVIDLKWHIIVYNLMRRMTFVDHVLQPCITVSLSNVSHRNSRIARNAIGRSWIRSPERADDSLFSFRERIHDISCHGHERESVLLPRLVYCFIETTARTYLRCPNNELYERLRCSWE